LSYRLEYVFFSVLHCHEPIWNLAEEKNLLLADKKVEFGRLIAGTVTIASHKYSDSSFYKNIYRFKCFSAF